MRPTACACIFSFVLGMVDLSFQSPAFFIGGSSAAADAARAAEATPLLWTPPKDAQVLNDLENYRLAIYSSKPEVPPNPKRKWSLLPTSSGSKKYAMLPEPPTLPDEIVQHFELDPSSLDVKRLTNDQKIFYREAVPKVTLSQKTDHLVDLAVEKMMRNPNLNERVAFQWLQLFAMIRFKSKTPILYGLYNLRVKYTSDQVMLPIINILMRLVKEEPVPYRGMLHETWSQEILNPQAGFSKGLRNMKSLTENTNNDPTLKVALGDDLGHYSKALQELSTQFLTFSSQKRVATLAVFNSLTNLKKLPDWARLAQEQFQVLLQNDQTVFYEHEIELLRHISWE